MLNSGIKWPYRAALDLTSGLGEVLEVRRGTLSTAGPGTGVREQVWVSDFSRQAGLKLLKVTTSAFPELHGQLLCARAQAERLESLLLSESKSM